MQKHLVEFIAIIDKTRCGDDNLLHDSREIAKLILAYVQYHFELKERMNFETEPLN